MPERKPQIYGFDDFRLDVENRQLLRRGRPVALSSKAFDMLVMLVEHGGRLVGKDELFSQVWPEQVVEESNLAVHVSAIRKALGERKERPRYIVTVPGHGYRFAGGVLRVDEEEEGLVIERHSVSRLTVETEKEAANNSGAVAARVRRAAKTVPEAVPLNAEVAAAGRETSIAGYLVGEIKRHRRGAFVALLTFIVAVAGIAWGLYKRSRPTTPDTLIRSIAVLPFKPLAAGSRDESLEMGMADTLISKLGGMREVVVRPVSAVSRYAGLGQDAVAAGREQRVDAVLDGSLQKDGDKVRVTVRLVRVEDGRQLWVEKFDEKFTDIFAVQDRVAEQVVELLAVRLTGPEQTLLTKRYTQNPEAYQLYLKGRYFWNKFTPADHRRAAEYFNQAIGKDPAYALAYTGLADTYAASATSSWIAPTEGYPQAKAAAKKALQLDETLAEAHASLGAVTMFYDLDWATAEREYRRAIELNPNYSTAYELYSYLQSATGRLDEAIETAQHGLETDPLSVVLSEDTGLAYYLARRYDEAIQQYQETVQMAPNYAPALSNLGIVYEQKGMYDEALAAHQKAIDASERTCGILAALGHTYAVSGRRGEALKILDELKEMSRQKYVSPYDLAVLYTGLGENERAIEQLGKAYEERAGWLIHLKVNPLFDPLHSDPRFTLLLRQTGLPQ